MKIRVTPHFLADVEGLVKKRKHYGHLPNDILSAVRAFSHADWHNHRQKLRDHGVSRLIKLSVKNSLKNDGASGGYRLYYLSNSNLKEIILLGVHPKTGPKGVPKFTAFQIQERLPNQFVPLPDWLQELSPE